MSDGDDDAPLADLHETVVDGAGEVDDADDADGMDDDTDDEQSTVRAEIVADETDSSAAAPDTDLETDDEPTVRSGPLSDMADDLADRRRGGEATDDDDLFESVDVGEVDPDELWEQVDADQSTVEPEPHSEEVRTISKSKYCQRCEYFADPPEVACHHAGTTIREEVDMEHFEVADCPKVLEDERLENV
ncbi:hypothetical protein [Haloarchaeobius sp. DT45]|uniref:hypothetical protein n=1 Tax=Haloarchaeobius sp. DT45 TaxID=3446116 RepID=UPI003F6D123F